MANVLSDGVIRASTSEEDADLAAVTGGAIVAVPLISKRTLYDRATDTELGTFDSWLAGTATTRQRLVFRESSQFVISEVEPVLVSLFGSTRAAELLAP